MWEGDLLKSSEGRGRWSYQMWKDLLRALREGGVGPVA